MLLQMHSLTAGVTFQLPLTCGSLSNNLSFSAQRYLPETPDHTPHVKASADGPKFTEESPNAKGDMECHSQSGPNPTYLSALSLLIFLRQRHTRNHFWFPEQVLVFRPPATFPETSAAASNILFLF